MDRATVPRTVSPERMTAGDHACLGFADDDARWEIRAAFAESGLFRGEQVIFFAAGGDAEEAAELLRAHGLRGAGDAVARGQILVVPQSPPDWATLCGNAVRGGYLGIRATSDMSWCARPGAEIDPDRLVSYETGLTPVLADTGLTAICEYDRRLLEPDVLGRVAAAHPVTVLGRLDALKVRRAGRVLRIEGEADLATGAEFEYALREGPPPEILDLAGLTFMDARCAGLVLRLGVAASDDGGAGLVVRCRPVVARTLRLCGAETVPRLVLTAA